MKPCQWRFLVAAGVALLASCEVFGPLDNPTDTHSSTYGTAVLSVQMGKASTWFTVGGTEQLTAFALPVSAANRALVWTSSDPETVSVDTTGLIVGVKMGSAKVVATSQDGGRMGSCSVTVKGTVTYSANLATAGTAPPNGSYAIGDSVPVAGNTGTLTREGYTFAGWKTTSDGTGTAYGAGTETFAMPDHSLTLYPIWNKQVAGGTTLTTPAMFTVGIAGPTTLHYGSLSTFTAVYDGTPTTYAWYLDTTATVVGTNNSLPLTPTVSTHTFETHVLTLMVTDANGLTYSGSVDVVVRN